MKILCIYHNNCADGFAAATVARMALGEDHVEFHPGNYGDPAPDVTGRDVMLVDFSYTREVLLSMAEQAKSILILDHHKSARDQLANLPFNIECHFDMDRSGAMMTWDYLYPGEPPPDLLKHIQDRDLWRFELPDTREIQAGLFSHPYDFEKWEQLLLANPASLRRDGMAIERKHHKDIAEFIEAAAYRTIIAGHNVPVLNAPYMWSSDAGMVMAKGESFAACYWDTPTGRSYSLRSNQDGIDVSEIAIQFGGGGHRNAAGFRLPREQLHLLPVGLNTEEAPA